MRPSYFLTTALVLVACGASAPEAAKVPAATGLAPGVCKSVATFTSSAAPQLQKDGCAGCHAGSDASATAALDLTSVGKDNAAACSQALRAVDLANRPQSAIIQAAVGAQAHKGGTVADAQAFTSALLGWIANE